MSKMNTPAKRSPDKATRKPGASDGIGKSLTNAHNGHGDLTSNMSIRDVSGSKAKNTGGTRR